jgi:hypothetical protein
VNGRENYFIIGGETKKGFWLISKIPHESFTALSHTHVHMPEWGCVMGCKHLGIDLSMAILFISFSLAHIPHLEEEFLWSRNKRGRERQETPVSSSSRLSRSPATDDHLIIQVKVTREFFVCSLNFYNVLCF